jgi:hypothetical protein
MKAIYCQYCGELLSKGCRCLKELAQAEADFIEEYENRPDVQYGWYQQDLIDMRRREQ